MKNIHHFHVLMLCSWLTLLVVQPILITRKKLAMHRTLGKVSYWIAPFVFLSMLLVYRNQYLKMVDSGVPQSESLSFVFSPATDAMPFIIFYLLAMFSTRDTRKHMRYIIATGLMIAGPGFGRIFLTWFGMDIFTVIQLVTFMTLIVFISLLIYDKVKNPHFQINPYWVAFLIWLVPNILIIFFPATPLWQSFALWLVRTV
jgi:hypothetical protein